MAIKTPGQLGSILYARESTYGVTPTFASSEVGFRTFGRMRTLDTTDDPGADTIQSDGFRTLSHVIFTQRECGFSAELSLVDNNAGGVSSAVHLLSMALGGYVDEIEINNQNDLPSFSAVIRIASDQWFLAKGCKIDNLTFSADGVGKQIRAKIDVICRDMSEQKESRAALGFTGMPGTAADGGPPATYKQYPRVLGLPDMPVWMDVPASSFELKISNNLTTKEGFDVNPTTGATGPALKAGSGIVPGNIGMELSLSVMSTSKFWDTLKRNGTSPFIAELSLSKTVLELRGCYLPGNDQPSRSHDVYDESITIIARDVSVYKK